MAFSRDCRHARRQFGWDRIRAPELAQASRKASLRRLLGGRVVGLWRCCEQARLSGEFVVHDRLEFLDTGQYRTGILRETLPLRDGDRGRARGQGVADGGFALAGAQQKACLLYTSRCV